MTVHSRLQMSVFKRKRSKQAEMSSNKHLKVCSERYRAAIFFSRELKLAIKFKHEVYRACKDKNSLTFRGNVQKMRKSSWAALPLKTEQLIDSKDTLNYAIVHRGVSGHLLLSGSDCSAWGEATIDEVVTPGSLQEHYDLPRGGRSEQAAVCYSACIAACQTASHKTPETWQEFLLSHSY